MSYRVGMLAILLNWKVTCSNVITELASTGRAVCKATHCKKEGTKIEKGALRQGTLVTINEHSSMAWRHWYVFQTSVRALLTVTGAALLPKSCPIGRSHPRWTWNSWMATKTYQTKISRKSNAPWSRFTWTMTTGTGFVKPPFKPSRLANHL